MRTHSSIIQDAGGAAKVAAALGLTSRHSTVKSWSSRDSIPAEHWAAFASQGWASLEELALAAASKGQARDPGDPANEGEQPITGTLAPAEAAVTRNEGGAFR